jgi:hypothetical protein
MTRASSSTTSPTPRVRVPRHVARLVVDYFTHDARSGDSARHAARRRLLLPRRASRCLGTSRGSSSTTSRRTAHRRLLHLRRAYGCLSTSRGSSSTSSPTPCVRVPWNVTRHVVWIVVDYFAYAARSGASARRAARHAARRRLFHLRRVSVCPGTSRGSLSTSSPTPRVRVPWNVTRHVVWLVADYFTYVARPGASARRTARREARRRLLHLHRASECPGTSRASLSTSSPTPRVRVPRHVVRLIIDYFSSHGSSSTTSPTPCVRVHRHIARLVVDYFSHAAPPGASARRAAHRQLLRLAQLVIDYFAYAVRTGASACQAARR